MSILLDDDDMFYVGMDVTKGGGDYADIIEVIRTSAKAQLKKVAEWGNELCKEHPEVNYPEKGTHYNKRHDCPICWQTLVGSVS